MVGKVFQFLVKMLERPFACLIIVCELGTELRGIGIDVYNVLRIDI